MDEVELSRLDHRLRHGLEGAHHGQPGRPDHSAPDCQEGDPIRQVRVAESRGHEADTKGNADQSQPAAEKAEPEPALEACRNVADPLRPTQPQDAREARCEIQQEQAPDDQIESRGREPDQLCKREGGDPERQPAQCGGEQRPEDAKPER